MNITKRKKIWNRERIKDMIYELTGKQKAQARTFFTEPHDSLIYTITEGIKGKAYGAGEPLQCVYLRFGYFSFLAGDATGEAASELVGAIRRLTGGEEIAVVSYGEGWEELLCEQYPEAEVRERAMMQIPPQGLDCEKIEALLRAYEDGARGRYILQSIDRRLYDILRIEEWADGMVTNFDSYEEFAERGFGYVMCDGEMPVSGCSVYSYYSTGVEIQVDTKEEYRGNGLAKIASAAMMQECMKRKLRPSWDAANPTSQTIAGHMGFVLGTKYRAVIFPEKKENGKVVG